MRYQRRLTKILAISLSISASVLSFSGCVSGATLSECQTTVIGAGSAYHPHGCEVQDLGDPDAAPIRWEGPTYVLPAATYKALMRSGGME